MDKDVVRVVFRMDAEGNVFALFPDDIADSRGNVTCYEHIGQHSAADYNHCIATSRPASVREYTDLANELRGIYGYQLQIRQRR